MRAGTPSALLLWVPSCWRLLPLPHWVPGGWHRLARRRMGDHVPGAAISYDAADRWVHEARDVRADFRGLFGDEPTPVVGIRLLTDADDTGGFAAACYGDISLHLEPESAEP